MRLNQYVAQATGISRRAADKAIATGHVKVNGSTAELGTKVTSQDAVTLAGKTVSLPETYTYLVLNKPVGYVTSRSQQGSDPTIYDLLPAEYHRLKPIGRLDKDSSGLLLLTNDGQLAHQLTHPSFQKPKSYHVTLNKELSEADEQAITRGVELEDGISHMQIHKLRGPLRRAWVVTITEGRNRQIRRTFEALGYSVATLDRHTFGRLNLGGLERGKYAVTSKEAII